MINIVYENKTKLKECELSIKHRSNDISQSNSSNSKFINITSPLPITYAQNSIELCYNIIKGSVQIFIDNIINTTALPSGSKIENLTDGFHNITIVLLSENEFTSKSYVIFRV